MVMDSSQIAAMAGGFNQQVTQGMQHSAMISQQGGGYAPMPGIHPVPTAGENLTGQLMQAGGNIGMQALSGRAATQGMGGLAAIPSGIGRNVLGQMMYGVQQQQGMDAMMRQSFRPQNQFGGIGFSSTQLGGMQQTMRGMSQERGPGVGRTTFEELGQLASNMGRMGYAENIRGVKDFNEKFREMLKAVKHVATELNTSLEEAQKMMASMRGVGVFGAGNQSKMLGAMRGGVMAGGAFGSVSEMSASMNVGSQLARSIGGRGRHGAMAGYQAAAQTSIMRNMGVLSEEDIFQVTGMEGVAGRQAYTQQKLQSDASFLRGRHGRVMLAAMMGEDGNLDPNAMQKIMTGGEAATDYMARGRRNLATSGTMGFLRNEGRLRGQAMALGGGNVRASFYRGELEKRGMDVMGGGDRPMLALQKIGKMNREQAEMAMKEIRNLDQASAFKESVSEDDQYFKELEQRHRQSSPEALAREVEDGKQKLNDSLREFGAGVYKSWSSRVNQYVKKMSGEMNMQTSRSLTGAMRSWDAGGATAESTERLLFGGGGGGMSALGPGFGGGAMTDKQFGRSLMGRAGEIKAAGYDPNQIQNREQFDALRERNKEMFNVAAPDQFEMGGGGIGGLSMSFDDALGDIGGVKRGLLETFAAAPIGGKNEQFIKNFETAISGRPELANLRMMLMDKSAGEKAGIIRKLGQKTGMQKRFGGKFAEIGGMGGGGMSLEDIGTQLGQGMGQVDLQGIIGGTNAQGGIAAGPQEFRGVSDFFGQGQMLAGEPGKEGGALGWLRGKARGLEDTLWNRPVVGVSQTGSGRQGLRDKIRDITGMGSTLLDTGVGGGGGLSKIPGLGAASRWLAKTIRPFEESVASQLGGQLGQEIDEEQKEALGQFAVGEEFYGQMSDLLSGNKDVSAQALTQVMTRQAELNDKYADAQAKGQKLGEGEMQELMQLKMMRATKKRIEFQQKHGRQPTREESAGMAGELKMGVDSFQALSVTGQVGLASRQSEMKREFADKLREGAEQEIKRSSDIDLDALKKSGEISEDVYQSAKKSRRRADIRAGYRTDREGAAEDFDIQELGRDIIDTKAFEGIGEGGGPGSMIGLGGTGPASGVGEARGITEDLEERFKGMSAAGIRKRVAQEKKTGMLSESQEARFKQRADITDRLTQARGRGRGEAGATATTAGFFGVKMTRKEAKGMTGEKFASTMMERMGMSDEDLMENVGLSDKERGGMVGKRDEMEKALSEMKGMKGSDRAKAMQDFQQKYQKEITAGARGNQDEKARKEDPVFRALEGLPDKLGPVFEKASKAGAKLVTTALEAIPPAISKAIEDK